MRVLFLLLLSVGLGSGCSSTGPGGGPSRARATPGAPVSSKPGSPGTGGRLDERVEGRVTQFHPTLRFVVLDFPLRRMPALEQRLSVYRDGRKVGEVKISGPIRDTTVAGDVMVGEAQVGDEVREE